MKKLRTMVLTTLIAAATGPAASAPGMGMDPGSGRGAARWGSAYAPGWALMSPQERSEHRDRMRSMKSYQDQHHAQMAERAQERGSQPFAALRRDACSALMKQQP